MIALRKTGLLLVNVIVPFLEDVLLFAKYADILLVVGLFGVSLDRPVICNFCLVELFVCRSFH